MLTFLAGIGAGATAVALASIFTALARARAESEHDPWLEACDNCGRVCPSPYGPQIVEWMVTHECEGAS